MNATKTVLLVLSVFLATTASLAQRNALKKGYAFAKPASYGRELKDLDGNTVHRSDTLYFVYLETKGTTKPTISGAAFNGRRFTASVVAVPEKRVDAGSLATTGKRVVLERAASDRFWLIELTPADGAALKGAPSGLRLKGTQARCAFQFSAARWTLLAPDIAG